MTKVGEYKGQYKYQAVFPRFTVVFREDDFFSALLALKRKYPNDYDSLLVLERVRW